MSSGLSDITQGDDLIIESAHPFPTKVKFIKHDDGDIRIKTANRRQGHELREEDGEIVLYTALEQTRIGSVTVSKRTGDIPITDLQEHILWTAQDADKGVQHNSVVTKFDESEQEAHEACMALGERGFLSFWTHRGYWSITEAGKDWLTENSEPLVTPYPPKHNRAADDGGNYTTYGIYKFIKTMQRQKEKNDEYNGDMIGFDPDDSRVSI